MTRECTYVIEPTELFWVGDTDDDTDPYHEPLETDDEAFHTYGSEPEGGDPGESEQEGEGEGEEPEEGSEQEGEEPDEPEEQESQSGKSTLIPKSRFDFKNRQLTQAQQRIQELEQLVRQSPQAQQQQPQAAQPPQQTPNLDQQLAEIDGKMAQAVADADNEAFQQLASQQRQLLDMRYQEMVQQSASNVTTEMRESMRYEATLNVIETQHPELNPDADTYDSDTESEVLDLMGAFKARGDSPADALTRAVNYVMGTRHAATEHEREPEPQQSAQPKPKPKAKRKTDVRRNVDTANKQPSDLSSSGSDSDSNGIVGQVNVMKLSQEQFEALTEAELEKLRGEDVA